MNTVGSPIGIECIRFNKRTADACSVERDRGDTVRLSVNLRETARVVNVCEGRRRDASPKAGAVSIVPPGCRYVQTVTGTASCILFAFPWARMSAWVERETDIDPERFQLRMGFCAEDDVLASALLVLAGGRPHAREEAAHALLGRLAGSHSNRAAAGRVGRASGGLAPAKMARFRDVVEARIGSDIGIGEMARELGYTEAHFIRAFKATTGVTPYRYVIGRRLEKALEALLTQRATIADVAVQMGFSHASHLSKLLRRRFGVTAGDFRRSVFPPRLLEGDHKVSAQGDRRRPRG